MQAPPLQSFPSRVLTSIGTPQALRGFTLIEVLVVIAILGVLAALAGPSFTPVIERWRVRQAVENMTSTIYYARSEAIKRGGNITVLKNALSTECPQASTTGEWSCGWMVFVDSNNDGSRQTSEEILQTFPVVSVINVKNNSKATLFKLDRWGHPGPLGFTFLPVGSGDSSTSTMVLCVSSGGRIQAKKASEC